MPAVSPRDGTSPKVDCWGQQSFSRTHRTLHEPDDRPNLTRALMNSLNSLNREEAWAELGGHTVWNKSVPPYGQGLDSYPAGGAAAPPLVQAPGGEPDEGNPHLAALDRALAVLEAPLMAARRVTIPLISADQFDRRWFLASALCTPPAIAAYFGAPLPAVLLTGVIGAGAAAVAAGATAEDPGALLLRANLSTSACIYSVSAAPCHVNRIRGRRRLLHAPAVTSCAW